MARDPASLEPEGGLRTRAPQTWVPDEPVVGDVLGYGGDFLAYGGDHLGYEEDG